MTLWQKAVHQLYDFSRLVGLRDRLRCPECKAVGTFKPHGGWLDFKDKRQTYLVHGVYVARKKRRWLCKWCGAYRGPEKQIMAYPNLVEGCWVLEESRRGSVSPPYIFHANTYRDDARGYLRRWTPWPWEG